VGSEPVRVVDLSRARGSFQYVLAIDGNPGANQALQLRVEVGRNITVPKEKVSGIILPLKF